MRFTAGQRVEWTSRSGILRRGEVVDELPRGQWLVRPDGSPVEQAVDGGALSLETVRKVAPAKRVVKAVPVPSMRLGKRQHGVRATYRQGCKCADCRRANRDYNRMRRRRGVR